jgi:hypothetical protein
MSYSSHVAVLHKKYPEAVVLKQGDAYQNQTMKFSFFSWAMRNKGGGEGE